MFPITPPEDPNPLFVWSGVEPLDGDLKVELSSGNGNNSVTIELLGSIGITSGGSVNRDGIGGVISFSPLFGQTTRSAVVGSAGQAIALSTQWRECLVLDRRIRHGRRRVAEWRKKSVLRR